MNACRWLEQLNETRASARSGALLTFNTDDRVIWTPEANDTAVASLRYFLAADFHQHGYSVGYYSLSQGFTTMTPPGEQENRQSPWLALNNMESPIQVLRQAGRTLRRSDARSVLILDYVEHLAPADVDTGNPERTAIVEMLHAWSLDDDIRHSSNFVVLISHGTNVHRLLVHEGGYQTITVDLPDYMHRKQFISLATSRLQQETESPALLAPDYSAEMLAHSTGGLRLMDIEHLINQADALDTPLQPGHVKEKKKNTIAQLCNDLVEVVESSQGFESVAGCNHAIEYFDILKKLWRQTAANLPQGILLAGVPGTGKSFLIKALAHELDCPCLVLRNVREPWVGQSERNLERVLQVLRNLSPCILWTDELDQNGGGQRSAGPSGDSGTNERMLGRLLEFFGSSEHRGRILWIATTNRPDLLDVAILDRFAVKIPFVHPCTSEREALLPVLAKQIGRSLASDIDCAGLAKRQELSALTVRTIQEILVWAGTLSDFQSQPGENVILRDALEQAIADFKPSFDLDEHELIALKALQMTSFNSLLPWRDITGSVRQGEWPQYLDGIVDGTTGNLDMPALERRLKQLTGERRV